jgi:hypothetical protein
MKPESRVSVPFRALWRTGVSLGTDEVSGVGVEAYQLSPPVTAENLAEVKAELATLVRQLLEQGGGAVQSGPEELTVGGLPGLRFRVTTTVDATPVESTLVYALDHTTEYFLNCQHTRDKAAEIQRGCDQIVRTFKVAAPGSATADVTASTTPGSRLGKVAFSSNRTGIHKVYL